MAAMVPWKTDAFDLAGSTKTSQCMKCLKPGAMMQCAHCKGVKYCDATCQKAHWVNHRLWCVFDLRAILNYLTDQRTSMRSMTILNFIFRLYQGLNDTQLDQAIHVFRETRRVAFKSRGKPMLFNNDGEHFISMEEMVTDHGAVEVVDLMFTTHGYLLSGCLSVIGLLAMLCMSKPEETLHPEMINMIYFLYRTVCAQKVHLRPFAGIFLGPEMTFCKPGKFGSIMAPHDTSNLLIQDPHPSVVVFHIHHTDAFSVPTGTLTDMWKNETSSDPTLNHWFMLIRNGSQAFIVQSFFGHYYHLDWCFFDQPLKQIHTPPTESSFFWPIQPTPRFRGLLADESLKAFYHSLDRLTQSGGHHQKDYADITGIEYPAEMDIDQFHILYFKLNPRHIIY